MYYETTYTIDSRDLDCFDVCRPSSLLGYLQDAAGLAADQFGASNAAMIRDHRHCWMVVRTGYALDVPLSWGCALTVKTWHRGGDKPLMYRDFDLLLDGRPVGQALMVWTLIDLETRTMTRPDHFSQFHGTGGGELIRSTKLPRLVLPPDLETVEERTFHYSDTDGNGHVNNTRYADLLCDAARLHTAPPGSFVRALRLDYLHECKAGQTLSIRGAWQDGKYFAQGLDGAGTSRFQGYLAL